MMWKNKKGIVYEMQKQKRVLVPEDLLILMHHIGPRSMKMKQAPLSGPARLTTIQLKLSHWSLTHPLSKELICMRMNMTNTSLFAVTTLMVGVDSPVKEMTQSPTLVQSRMPHLEICSRIRTNVD